MNTVRIELKDTKKILFKPHLQNNREVQLLFTKEVAKQCNNYTPFKTGRLKDMMVELQTDKIIYNAFYAFKQYYGNKGNGNQSILLGVLRDKVRYKKMWIDKGDKIVESIAGFCGGRNK